MYYAPSRPIEIEKFPKGYIKPIRQNLEFLQRPPEDNRRIQDYYGKAQEQFERHQNKVQTNMNQDQIQRFPEQKQYFNRRQQENRLKDNQKYESIMNPKQAIFAQRFESVPFNTIFTDDNIYKAVPENTTQSNVQPLEREISTQSLGEPQRDNKQGFRGFSQDFQQPGFFPQDSRDMGQQGLGFAHQEYRRMAPPGILSEYRRGIPEPIYQKRNNWIEERRDFGDRVYPVGDYYQQVHRGINYDGESVILNERNVFPQEFSGAAYLNSDRQHQYDNGMYNQHRAVPVPDYYVPEYEGNIGMWRERERIYGYGNLINQAYPVSYGKRGQQMQREGRHYQNGERDYWSLEERRYGQDQRIKQG